MKVRILPVRFVKLIICIMFTCKFSNSFIIKHFVNETFGIISNCS